MKNLEILIFILLLTTAVGAQNTVGLLSFDLAQQYDGYNLFYPHNQPNVFLLDNCGEIVHTWEDTADFRPGNTAYILEDGSLVKTKRPASVAGDPIWAGGGGSTVEIRSWDNELLWTFTINDSLARLHHDIQPMPNGNILMIVWELKTEEEAIAAGRDTALLPDQELWPDYIIEVEPIGVDQFEVVWEWHVWDHLIQDLDSTRDNFGVVADHPELMDVNYQTNEGAADWLHTNQIDYNEQLDQIMISVPFVDEIWILDHSTTTEEAAGHTGGISGMGGDIIFRWGNPQVYHQGTEEDQRLFNQHDANWIDDFIPFSHPQFGNISVYNNAVGDVYSTVNIIRPTYDMYGGNYVKLGDVFAPADFEWTYVHPDTFPMYSSGLSSVQLLANGNTLICAGRQGYTFEINTANEIIWEYETPLRAGQAVEQGTILEFNDNLTFRNKRYPMDYAAFEGRDLTPDGFIELNPDADFCDLTVAINDPDMAQVSYIYPNPAQEVATIEWMTGGMGYIDVYGTDGRKMHSEYAYGGRAYVDISQWQPGLYIVHINQEAAGKLLVMD